MQTAPQTALSTPTGEAVVPSRRASPAVPQSLTTQSYSIIVQKFSELTSGIGVNHEQLARFLAPLRNIPPETVQSVPGAITFLTIYEFTQSQDPQPQGRSLRPGPSGIPIISAPKWNLVRPLSFSDPKEFARHVTANRRESPGQIIFLRGYPSPHWLGLVGSTYRVDPEFFSRALDFPHASGKPENFTFPSLPSSGWNIVEIPVVSIGKRVSVSRYRNQDELDKARTKSAEALRTYHDQLYGSETTFQKSTSIIRDICLFDETHFALEHKVTVCMQAPDGLNGWVLHVAVDASDDLADNALNNVWHSVSKSLPAVQYHLSPIVRYRPNMALNVHALLKFEENDSKTLPSISSLHLNYGRSLRENVMAEDPFYALSEVFALTTASQKQFLNLVEHKLAEYTNLADSYFDALPNLRYLKQVLLRQRQQIRATRLFIRNAKPPKWAKAVSDVGKRARTAVEQDYSHLGDHAEDLDKRCQEAITVLMSSVAIADSKKAIMQAERVAKLTFLAFIFGPLSFTTSFFGMNFNELSGQSIWEWFVLTTSVLTVTLLFFFCDVSRHWKSCIEYIKDRLR